MCGKIELKLINARSLTVVREFADSLERGAHA
jgi:hypothetical protein